MSYIDILGIENADSLKEIKKSYAFRLKQIDQAAEPEFFQRLNEAYQEAMADHKKQNDQNVEDLHSEPEVDAENSESKLKASKFSVSKNDEFPQSFLAQALDKFTLITNEFTNESVWIEFFDLVNTLSIDEKSVVGERVLNYLMQQIELDKSEVLSIDFVVRQKMIQIFRWQENELALSKHFTPWVLNEFFSTLTFYEKNKVNKFIPKQSQSQSNTNYDTDLYKSLFYVFAGITLLVLASIGLIY
jgi:hypothetical protein